MKHVLSLLVLLVAWPNLRAGAPKQQLNVPYGTHPRQVLDFFRPSRTSRRRSSSTSTAAAGETATRR